MALRHAATREIGSDRRPVYEVKNGQAGPDAHWGYSAMPTEGWGLEIGIRPWTRPRAVRCIVNGAKWHCMCHRAGFTVAWNPKRASHIVPTTVAGVGAGWHVDRVSSRPPPRGIGTLLQGFQAPLGNPRNAPFVPM